MEIGGDLLNLILVWSLWSVFQFYGGDMSTVSVDAELTYPIY